MQDQGFTVSMPCENSNRIAIAPTSGPPIPNPQPLFPGPDSLYLDHPLCC